MDTIRINPLIVSVSPTDHTLISPIEPTMHKGGIGKLVSVVAMVAIPWAAPAIATSIAASGVLGAAVTSAMTTGVGGIISSAIAGAALGAVTAAVTGQPISAGALMGGIGGGIGGYMEGVSAGIGAEGSLGTAPPRMLGDTSLPTLQSTASPDAIAKLRATAGGSRMTGGLTLGGATEYSKEMTYSELLKSTGQAVASKLTDEKALASLTLEAAGSLIGEAMVPEGTLATLSPEEQGLLEERKAELVALRDRDLNAYNQAIELSKQYMVQAGHIDPTYFANQEMAQSKVQSGRRIREIEESAMLNDKNFTAGDKARLGLDSSRLASSKYDEGFQGGLNLQTSYLDKAVDTLPEKSPTGYSEGLGKIGDVYAGLRGTADKERENIQKMFAGLNLKEGNTKEDEARKAALYGYGYQAALDNMGTS